jgi:hypothetical protein
VPERQDQLSDMNHWIRLLTPNEVAVNALGLLCAANLKHKVSFGFYGTLQDMLS